MRYLSQKNREALVSDTDSQTAQKLWRQKLQISTGRKAYSQITVMPEISSGVSQKETIAGLKAYRKQ
jgi:hypothetical protein